MDSTAPKGGQDKVERPEPLLPWKARYKAFLTRVVLFWEAFWAASWIFWGALLGIFTLILLDFPSQLAVWAHLTFLFCSTIILIFCAILAIVKIKIPSHHAAIRRLERENKLEHRPLSSLADRPLRVTVSGLSLWLQNRRRMAKSLGSLKISRPKPILFRLDPYGFRALIVTGLFIASFSIEQWPVRISSAFELTRLLPSSSQSGVNYSIWLTPPDYTGLAPLFFDQDFTIPKQLDLPEGSRVIIQVHGLETSPDIKLDAQTIAVEQTGETSHRGTFRIDEGGTLSIKTSFRTLLSTQIYLQKDLPPEISFTEVPQANNQGLLRISFDARDDYGTKELDISFWQNNGEQSEHIKIPLPASRTQEYSSQHYLDLTDHILAGEDVWFQLTVKDALDQVGQTEAIKILLPERNFTHPLARILVKLRKDLNVPENKMYVIQALRALVKRPDEYNFDSLVALTMTIAGKHLIFDHSFDSVRETQSILWKTALHLEDGRISNAQRELREIQQQLRDALSSNADQEEIFRLMDKLQQAVDSLLSNMLEEYLKDPEKNKTQTPPDNVRTLERKDLQSMIEQARMLAESGSMEEALELLSQMQNMLENLAFQQGQQPSGSADDKGRETFEKLQELTRRQEELLENSYNRQQENRQRQEESGTKPSSKSVPGDSRPGEQGREQQLRDARSQEMLRQELEKMMENLQNLLGSIPEDFNQAEQSMGIARNALKGQDGNGNETDQVIKAQTRSLRKLQNGTEQAAEKYLKLLSQAPGRGSGWVSGKDGSGRDPFGRNVGSDGSSISKQGVPLPNKADFLESRSILKELRNRRNDRSRPKDERTYIQKLLERF